MLPPIVNMIHMAKAIAMRMVCRGMEERKNSKHLLIDFPFLNSQAVVTHLIELEWGQHGQRLFGGTTRAVSDCPATSTSDSIVRIVVDHAPIDKAIVVRPRIQVASVVQRIPGSYEAFTFRVVD